MRLYFLFSTGIASPEKLAMMLTAFTWTLCSSNLVRELTVSTAPGDPSLYACLATTTAWRLYMKDGDFWYERSAGLPADVRVRMVVPHPTNNSWAYALMNGLATPGEKVFFTEDRGQSWTNITGNLPNVQQSDLVVHPDDDARLYVSSEYGCYRSEDGGGLWQRWNNGLPEATVVTELKTVDMRYFGQGYHVVAATFGRSIWRRDISGEDPITSAPEVPPGSRVTIRHAAPNPFNPATTIHFDLAIPGLVEVEIYDLDGAPVRTLLAETRNAGQHAVRWDGCDDAQKCVASGVYLVGSQPEPKWPRTRLSWLSKESGADRENQWEPAADHRYARTRGPYRELSSQSQTGRPRDGGNPHRDCGAGLGA